MDITTINNALRDNASRVIEKADAGYAAKVEYAASAIANHLSVSRLVFLSGPSGSGKTTTAKRLEQALLTRGIGTYVISQDEYFLDGDQTTHLINEDGERDFESPECMDLPMLRAHYEELSRGGEILVPRFNFKTQKRMPGRERAVRLKQDEVAIFEGIHALNPALAGPGGASAFKLYISTRTDYTQNGQIFFKHTLLRLVRRAVRDHFFRGADIGMTLSMWDNVRRGELKHISPYKDSAHLRFDTMLVYEASALKPFALPLFERWHATDTPRRAEFESVANKLRAFETVDVALLPSTSLLREFIGGGDLHY